jgi:predicted nucleotidyltransferase
MKNTILETLLGSRLRAKVLGWLFTHPEEHFYVRQLTALVQGDSTNVSRELARLEKTGILVSTTEGKQKYYQANRQYPLFDELKGLMARMAHIETDSKAADSIHTVATAETNRRINISKRQLTAFCRKHHIKTLALFGSVLRDDFQPDSDVDVLVEFEEGHVPGFAIIDMENELSRLVGRKVDLRTPGDLSRYFRDRVMHESKVQYAATA